MYAESCFNTVPDLGQVLEYVEEEPGEVADDEDEDDTDQDNGQGAGRVAVTRPTNKKGYNTF